MMRIVSLNAWGGALFGPLAAWLIDSAADVLCLQEVPRTPGVSGWTTFRDAERYLPQRANLFDDVSRLLPQHLASYVASDAGPVSLPDGAALRQEFGLGMFVEPTATIVGQRASLIHPGMSGGSLI